ncbi:MAG: hypothetical protein OZSIB_0093 [Candidatus Ozemobacter sibiricus]|jgi:prepilin-type N-terminal cleavage/methylation domain-containing protein|uniref:Type II secretion system protein n=1 Tax=Candidatus Ozemobacter sibiricus TaxID=2268124 RepID=A0A367ZMV9_9BACT|nr:MAG: hypothetical protein OZSIB_0093 [Candidatus Ozemobacter sibiricus]
MSDRPPRAVCPRRPRLAPSGRPARPSSSPAIGRRGGRAPRRAFTLIEVLVAMIFLSLALLSLMWMNQASTRGAMDAYYEFLGQSLAQEPLEVYRALGYDWLARNPSGLPDLPIGAWQDVSDGPTPDLGRPAEAGFFSRLIETARITDGTGLSALRLTVTVRPRQLGRVEAWLTRNQITRTALLFPRPP